MPDLNWDVAFYHARLRDELLQTQVFIAGNAAAAALPLLCAIARGAPARIALPWLGGDHVVVAITPCR
jgi:hypothetical protein